MFLLLRKPFILEFRARRPLTKMLASSEPETPCDRLGAYGTEEATRHGGASTPSPRRRKPPDIGSTKGEDQEKESVCGAFRTLSTSGRPPWPLPSGYTGPSHPSTLPWVQDTEVQDRRTTIRP